MNERAHLSVTSGTLTGASSPSWSQTAQPESGRFTGQRSPGGRAVQMEAPVNSAQCQLRFYKLTFGTTGDARGPDSTHIYIKSNVTFQDVYMVLWAENPKGEVTFFFFVKKKFIQVL